MQETIDLRWKELCAEMKLRQAGKKGEWDIPTEILVQLWLAKRVRLPMMIAREIKEK